MRGDWIDCSGNKRLIVVVLGWSCDTNMVKHLRFEGYDIFATYDYRDLNTEGLFDSIDFAKYEGVSLIAWSFGVWVADLITPLLPRLDKTIAINGTSLPVDNNYGIPAKIFKITIWAIDKLGLDKFNERMCGDFLGEFTPSLRPFDEQFDELLKLSAHFKKGVDRTTQWQNVIIGDKDVIFPVENMVVFWDKKSTFVPIIAPLAHYPFCKQGVSLINKILNENNTWSTL